MEEKALLTPAQFAMRCASILATAMGALAFIVISFVASTWESIPADQQRFAFVVVNASGAHFIFSLAFALPTILLCRLISRWGVAIGVAVGSAAYIYCALILQHRGLADSLLAEPWVSIFPFGQAMISLVHGPNLEINFYLIPLVAAWAIGGAVGLVLGLAEGVFSGANKGHRG